MNQILCPKTKISDQGKLLSDQGKLLIPRDLCEQARLLAGAEVMRVGRHRYFEIWNRENRMASLGIV